LPSSPITSVTSAVTVTGTYKTQWQITFKQTGIGGDTGSNTVVTVAGSPKAAGDLDYPTWVDNSSPLSFTWAATTATSPASGKRYAFVSSSPATLPSVTSAVTVTGTYKTQYYLTIATVPGLAGRTNVLPTADAWYDSGIPVNLMATT